MRRLLPIPLLIAPALIPPAVPPALANPLGPQVVGGSASVQGQGTANVTVTQSSERAIINWNTFDIGRGETTRFVQPDASAVTLNRVTGGVGPSQIYGTLTANGRVFLVNPDGVLFGSGAVVDTAGFLATTSDVKNSDFMAGRYNFTIPGRPDASIVNLGAITAHTNGFAALVAPGVRNSGTITAQLGTVALAAGNAFTLDFYGDRLITLALGDEVARSVRDVATGQTLQSLVKNDGALKANGGRVEITAGAARQVVDAVINNTGVIEANAVGARNGMIVLSAATAATKPADAPRQTVRVGGSLSAAGKNKGERGGKIQITGEDIKLSGARLDASGDSGGGTVLVGGDWAGGRPNGALVSNPSARLEASPVPTAANVSVDAGTTIDASATQTGNGGKVIVWSDGATSFAGAILARGGALSGDGGFVETSGRRQLNFTGAVDLRAPKGWLGTLLLDPGNLTIQEGESGTASGSSDGGTTEFTGDGENSILTVATLQNALGLGNVVVTTGPGNQAGDITVASSVSWSNASSLILSAHRDININEGVTIANTGSGSLSLRADSQGSGVGAVNFYGGWVNFAGSTGAVSIFYNPPGGYAYPTNYGSSVLTNPAVANQFTAYMLVNNVGDLQNIQQNLSGAYALGRDIDASWTAETAFTPIGSLSNPFVGVLDGQFRWIDQLTIATSNPYANSIGLFGAVGAGGSVSNLFLTNVNVTANPYPYPYMPVQFIGALAGQNAGRITNVFASGTVDGGNLVGVVIGGLVGQNGLVGETSTAGTLSQSGANVIVNVGAGNACVGFECGGAMNIAGGLVGSNVAGSIVTSSWATGAVSGGGGAIIGGLVGQNGTGGPAAAGVIVNSFAIGNVVDSGVNSMLGGLVGVNAFGSSVTDSWAAGNVTANASVSPCFVSVCEFINAGGLVGHNQGTIAGSFAGVPYLGLEYSQTQVAGPGNVIPLHSSFITVSVGANGHAGGLVGFNQGTITASGAYVNVVGAPGASSERMTTLGGLVGTNQGTITLSHAFGKVGDAQTANLNAGGLVGSNSGTITASDAFGDVSVGDGGQAGGLVGGNGPSNCAECIQIGDGASNEARIESSSAYGAVTGGASSLVGGLAGAGDGLFSGVHAFGSVSGGRDSLIGGLIGGLGPNGLITWSDASGAAAGLGPNSMVGGLVGANFGAVSWSFYQPVSSGAGVTGGSNSYLGGLVGLNVGSITQSFAAPYWPNLPLVSSSGSGNVIGGLAGANAGLIESSSATGAVNGGAASAIGGLVGANLAFLSSGTIAGSSFPIGTVSHSFATGSVLGGEGSNVGGFAGVNNGQIVASYAIGSVGGGQMGIAGGLVGWNAVPYTLPSYPGLLQSCGAGCQDLAFFLGASLSAAPGSISQSWAYGAVTSPFIAGGLIGWNEGAVTQSNAAGAVSGGGFGAGGLAGWNLGAITQSYATGSVSGEANVFAGGLVGVNFGAIAQSFALGPVSGGANSYVGGLAGANFQLIAPAELTALNTTGSIFQSYATGAVTGGPASYVGALVAANGGAIDQAYAVGLVTGGAGSTLGGLVALSQSMFAPGLDAFALSSGPGTVVSAYWDVQTTGQATSAAGVGLTTAQLSAILPSGFAADVWSLAPTASIATPYPYFGFGSPPQPADTIPAALPGVSPPPSPADPGPAPAVHSPPTTPPPLVQLAALNQNFGPAPVPAPLVTESSPPAQTGQSGRPGGRSVNRPFGRRIPVVRQGSGVPPPGETRFIANEVLLQVADVPRARVEEVARRLGLSIIGSQDIELIDRTVYRFRIEGGRTVADVIRALEANRITAAAQPNYVFSLTQDQEPAQISQGDSAQYAVEKLRLPEAHRLAKGKSVLVAVIDSEIDADHPDLAGVVVRRFDATGGEEKPHPHGTGMAGAIASHRKLLGVAPGVRLLAVSAFGAKAASAEATSFQILKGLEWAVNEGARVVNMSFAGPKDPGLQQALKLARDKGVVLVAAAGNAGPKSPPLYPGADPSVIAVTAIDVNDKVFAGANRGRYIAVAAPGVDVLVPAPESAYQMTTGTSVAAAHVSGVVALLLERNPSLTPDDVRKILKSSARKLGSKAEDLGAGLVDAYRAVISLDPNSTASVPSR